MYNRYVRQDDGTYTRFQEAETPPATPPGGPAGGGAPPSSAASSPGGGAPPPSGEEAPPFPPPPPGGIPFGDGFGSAGDGLGGYFRRLLDHLHLDRIDTGDLLLLGLLYFLFREKADEELLIALGLLLIL